MNSGNRLGSRLPELLDETCGAGFGAGDCWAARAADGGVVEPPKKSGTGSACVAAGGVALGGVVFAVPACSAGADGTLPKKSGTCPGAFEGGGVCGAVFVGTASGRIRKVSSMEPASGSLASKREPGIMYQITYPLGLAEMATATAMMGSPSPGRAYARRSPPRPLRAVVCS